MLLAMRLAGQLQGRSTTLIGAKLLDYATHFDPVAFSGVELAAARSERIAPDLRQTIPRAARLAISGQRCALRHIKQVA